MLLESYFEFAADTAIRLKGTRVGIEKVVEAYLAGASAEETVLRYPTLSLEQVHATLTYYLANRQMVDAYVARVRQQQASDWEQQTLAETPFVQSLRARLAQQSGQEVSGADYSDYSFAQVREILKVVPGHLSSQVITDREDRL